MLWRETTTDGGLFCRLEVRIGGRLKLYNTMEAFRSSKRTEMLEDIKRDVERSLQEGSDEAFRGACQFRMLAFADLKRHRFYFQMLYPAVFLQGLAFDATSQAMDMDDVKSLRSLVQDRPLDWFIRETETRSTTSVATAPAMVVVVDPSEKMEAGAEILGWPVRNALFWCYSHLRCTKVALYVLRQSMADSVLLHVSMEDGSRLITSQEACVVTGWERCEHGEGMMVDLAPMMDSKKLAQDAANLNLRLIQWRLLPQLDLSRFAECRILLLGAGTLGCNVTRLLLVSSSCRGGTDGGDASL